MCCHLPCMTLFPKMTKSCLPPHAAWAHPRLLPYPGARVTQLSPEAQPASGLGLWGGK